MRVVLGEDLALLRDGLVLLLQAHGFDIVAAATSGPELLAALREHRPDVAVVDVRLPPTFTDEGLQAALTARREMPGRPPAPVESAAYFAVAEALANALKHAAATTAWVQIAHEDERLKILVGDDGVGGATVRPGGGLYGIERRLAAFDGTLTVASPTGGPTTVIMELPCESSSLKITPSSGTA